ncbi:MAG TPA: xanthine dehydrogenase family protein molybdopterin-binding subunit [Streptosporangiaceae bacterium]
MSYVGSRVGRLEDPRLLTGAGRFADDEDRPGQLWMRVVRSQVAHAMLGAVDTSGALALDGIRAVLTAADVSLPPIPVRVSPDPSDLLAYLQPVLAQGRVRYVGEPVAVVVADDPYQAEDGADLVAIDYAELAPVRDARAACGAGAPQLFHRLPNEVAVVTASFGDVAAAFRDAAHVVELDVVIGRQTAVPIEPRSLLAEWDEAGQSLDVWGATKVPHFNRRVIAEVLGIPPAQVRMHWCDAGGGFGVRGELYPEDILVAYLARLLGRPVKWTEDRAEHLVAVNHSRDQAHRIAGAFDSGGRLLAIRDEIWHDNGAYIRTHGLTVPELTVSMLPGPYRMASFEATAHVAVTNKTPCGTYRAPGRYEGTFARERMLDTAASVLGIDPVELRRRNLLGPGELPCDRSMRALGTDVVLDEGDYPGLLERAMTESGYLSWVQEARERRCASRLVGTGMAVFLEKSGLGPYEVAEVQVDHAGRVQVTVGGTSLGQGIETVLAQIAADVLGVCLDNVRVIAGDTEMLGDGVGSWASRSTVVGGSAVLRAAEATGALARQAAAVLLGAGDAELRLAGGRVNLASAAQAGSQGQPGERGGPAAVSVTLGEIAAALADRPAGTDLPPGPLGARREFSVDHMTYPYGVHLAQVEIDPGTGAIRVLRYFVAYEVGHAINPATVEGQLVGGALQGIGGALFEEVAYSPEGQPLTASLIDYLLPSAHEAPDVGTLVTEDYPSRSNPLGAKGAGEGGITAVGAAIASAVGDALGTPSVPTRLPITPERVCQLIDDAQRRICSLFEVADSSEDVLLGNGLGADSITVPERLDKLSVLGDGFVTGSCHLRSLRERLPEQAHESQQQG